MKVLVFIYLLCMSAFASGQSVCPAVVSSNGNFFSNSSVSIAWSVGETLIQTAYTANYNVTQGFHQPDYGIFTNTYKPLSSQQISIYPNPAAENIQIQFGETSMEYVLDLIDVQGRTVLHELYTPKFGKETSYPISLLEMAPGPYFLCITEVRSQLRNTYTVIKPY